MNKCKVLPFTLGACFLLTACGDGQEQEENNSEADEVSHCLDGACMYCEKGWVGAGQCSECDTTIAYGDNCTFYGTMTDQAGKSYKTAVINGVTWMAENLAYETGSYYYPNGHEYNVATYGLLYDGNTAKTVCPAGWHLPTIDDYQALVDYVGADESGYSVAVLLNDQSWSGTNYYGFSVLPAGWFEHGSYSYFNSGARFWTATKPEELYLAFFDIENGDIRTDCSSSVSYGYSVRCIKDSN